MTVPSSKIFNFRPRVSYADPPFTPSELISRLVSLAGDADRSGFPNIAILLVGAAYGIADGEPPDNVDGQSQRARHL